MSGSGGGAGTGGASGGGSGGTGGSGGSGGATVVTSCDHLGEVGSWQNVEPATFHSPSNMQTIVVVVDPRDQSVLAAASNKTNGGSGSTGVYKSNDCGATWKLWGTGAHASDLSTGQLWAMLIDPGAPDNVYIANGYGNDPTLYKSTNGGVDWTPLKTDPEGQVGFVQAVAIEPASSKHVAVTFHENCKSPRAQNCMASSTDGGATWAVFDGPKSVAGWREGASLSVLGATKYLYLCDVGVFYTADGGVSWSKVLDGTFGRYAGSTDLAPDGSLYVGISNHGIYRSPPNALGASWTLLDKSPQSTNLVDDGVSLFAAEVNGPPFFTARLDTTGTWTHMSSPTVSSGSNEMAYDAAHHLVYSANFGNGLLRLLTR
jgi:hypothetical protein